MPEYPEREERITNTTNWERELSKHDTQPALSNVDDKVARAVSELESLSKQLERLFYRLENVLMPDQEAVKYDSRAEREKDIRPQSLLANQLETHAEHLYALNRKVGSVIERLEI